MRARKRPVFFGPERQLCMQFGFTQSSETECNGAVKSDGRIAAVPAGSRRGRNARAGETIADSSTATWNRISPRLTDEQR
eukprot:COSAG05_NODE_2398_length_3113_cov_2.751493_2_plen_80_part_00